MRFYVSDGRALDPAQTRHLTGVSLTLGDQRTADGIPFFLEDDGTYAHDLNRFFRELPTLNQRAENSWLAMARDVDVWARFLGGAGVSLWEATPDHMLAYQRARRGPDSNAPLSVASWNRAQRNLLKLYLWARGEGIVQRCPVPHRSTGSSATPSLVEPVPSSSELEAVFLTWDEFRVFVEIGLQGRSDLGQPQNDKLQAVRCNVAIAWLLVTTGLRIDEALLTLCDDPGVWGRLYVPPHIRKHCRRAVNARIPQKVQHLIRAYIRNERELVVQSRGSFGVEDAVVCRLTEDHRYRIVGSRGRGREGSSLTRKERRRLFVQRDCGLPEPVLLFLNTAGEPLTPETFAQRLADGNRRIHDAGYDLTVTAHDLRHTFAVHRLDQLVRTFLENRGPGLSDSPHPGSDAYRAVAKGDPLFRLQVEMGHSRFESTLRYLNPGRDETEFAWALDGWRRETQP